MDEELAAIQEIENRLIEDLKSSFGYCGVMKGDGFTMLNSGQKTNLVIKIIAK